ncbi:MAG: aminodeoxychorismate/anthranilate synthase component II [Tannerellaceae bacterium]|nr:aminodeoxychorismate/anthranilate synthase component II [Tannerellaceae bacterium]
MKTLIIDNYDSFTFNLYQIIAAVNEELPIVIRNDQYSWPDISNIMFDNIVISPGPGTPLNKNDFGVCYEVLRNADVPILGVCLGHQGFGHVYGAQVVHAPEIMHGRLSKVLHNEDGLFKGIPQGFEVVRYHSLIIKDDLPECLEKIAWTEDGIIMGLRHFERPIWGVQFHPESICTEFGKQILKNFAYLTKIS